MSKTHGGFHYSWSLIKDIEETKRNRISFKYLLAVNRCHLAEPTVKKVSFVELFEKLSC
jgi:hypothetical protein